jgi:uncharacterized protein YndB with AHSA1/START domain
MLTGKILGAESREVGQGDHEGRPARVVVASRTYETDPDDLWDALTSHERIPLWFLPVSGDLDVGGRYQLEGNAGGTVTRCVPPWAFEVTWEFGGDASLVSVGLQGRADGTRLTLEHILPVAEDDAQWTRYGPGAVGVGWDLALMALGLYLQPGSVDRADVAAWTGSEAGKAFMRDSAVSWGEAHIAGGVDPETARGMAKRTAEASAEPA